jgi:large repetitive protein
MKNLIKLLAPLYLLLCIGQINAQESYYVRQPGYWTLGLNGGLAYQSSDIKTTLQGWGVGATLAKNLYYQPGSTFAFDLRGRLLYDQSYGLDHFRSYGIVENPTLQNYLTENGGEGYVFQNNKTHHGELGLEGVLSFNRLREKTNINLAFFGGIGLGYYATLMDQKDGSGQIYDYSSIDPEGRRQPNKADLQNLLDGRYESKAEGFGKYGQLGFMPDLGIELGYQLTPRFSIGLGHKLTFTRTDLFDGNQWNESNRVTGDNDLHHYTNLHLRWILEEDKEEQKPPVIELLNPISSPHQTRDPLAIIKAKIKHINSAMDIRYEVNGRTADFDFRKEILDDNFYLRPGENVVDITATNSAGSDQERVIIYYREVDVVTPPTTDTRNPRVNFTNPANETEYVANERYRVTATVLNVDRQQDIDFKVNGRSVSDFDFDARNDRFSADIVLRSGENRLQITVSNSSRLTDSDEAVVMFDKKEIVDNLPVVTITRPSSDPYTTKTDRYNIEADVFNVPDKIDISFTVNGERLRSFNFENNKVSGTVSLKEGNNNITITGKNNRGVASDQVTIRYDKEVEVSVVPPVVKITSISQPAIDPFNPTVCKVSVKADVKNVDGKSDIQFYLDGQLSSDFTYSGGKLTAVLNLIAGGDNHTVRIKASNKAGSDEDSEQITSCSGTPTGEAPEVDITAPTQTTTDNASQTIKASIKNVEDKNDITVKLNGRKVNRFDYDSRTKTLSAAITLDEGNNTVIVTAANNYGTDSDEITIRYNKAVVPQKTPPVVTISSPDNNSTTSASTAVLTGTVEHVFEKKDISVLLNGSPVTRFDFATRNGRLTADIKGLRVGKNTITIKATNADGQDEASIEITFKEAMLLPKVTITSPKNATTTDKNNALVNATLANVTTTEDITFKVNGKTVKDFTYRNNQLTATINLKEGKNEIFVEGENESGKHSDQIEVTYKEAVPLPVVSITSPRTGTQTSAKTVELTATLTNVASNDDITVKVNGRELTKYSFRKGILTATVNLQTGKNTLFIEGRNSAGKDSGEVTVTHQAAAPPQINGFALSQPTIDPFNPTVAKTNATATLVNINSKNQIKLYLNGKSVTDFDFDTSTNKVKKVLTLAPGNNTVKLVVENEDGRVEETRTMEF